MNESVKVVEGNERKFNVGDRVKINGDNMFFLILELNGAIGTVVEYDKNKTGALLILPDDAKHSTRKDGNIWLYEHDIELCDGNDVTEEVEKEVVENDVEEYPYDGKIVVANHDIKNGFGTVIEEGTKLLAKFDPIGTMLCRKTAYMLHDIETNEMLVVVDSSEVDLYEEVENA